MLKLIRISKCFKSYRNFGQNTFSPLQIMKPPLDDKNLKKAVETIYEWSQKLGAKYYSFLGFPHTSSITQKQQTFLGLNYFMKNAIEHLPYERFSVSDILRGETDGSSLPNGGLRATHQARGHFVWDMKSKLFVHNNVLYIPAFLIGHQGQALDDKTAYRRAESFLEKQCTSLLKIMNIESTGIFIGVGLEQQFFIIPKTKYLTRLDLNQTQRVLIGKIPPYHQQFSDHYYSKLTNNIQIILSEAEQQLNLIGVPIKTRHKQVAVNQYQICSIFQEASQAIDHNLIKMFILEEVLGKHGFVPLWHEKPFKKMNGSGKHLNWSLNYFDKSNKIRNLFSPQGQKDELFLLFILIKMKAILSNQQLYLSTVSVPGNQLRLGGHQAPPRIFSVCLGDSLTNMIQSIPQNRRINFQEKLTNLGIEIKQEDTDRNRTSPYAYSTNRFQFRAVGSSQNCYFPLTVILTTLAKEIQNVGKKIKQGKTVKQLIMELTNQTQRIRFNGDGYSQKWIEQAKARKLYIAENFTDNIQNIKKFGNVLIQSGVYTERELISRKTVSEDIYLKTVQTQAKTMLILINKNIIPRICSTLQQLSKLQHNDKLAKRSKKIQSLLQKLIQGIEKIQKNLNVTEITLIDSQKMRKTIQEICQIAEEVIGYLPDCESLPELYDILGKF